MVFLEAGNTFVKAVKPAKGEYTELFKVKTDSPNNLRRGMGQIEDGDTVLFSSVRRDASNVIFESESRLSLHKITHENLGVVSLDYHTPGTLGIDRVLACLGALADAGGKSVIVIDAGSACTIDFMEENYIFRGGVIMPGLQVQKKAMKDLLPELPGAEPELPAQFPGKTTKESIQWGLYGGFYRVIGSFIDLYRRDFNTASAYASGGDGESVSAYLQQHYGIQVSYRKNLVFDGMKAYLDLNKG